MTELEMAMTDWLARAIGLPEHFCNSHSGPGAGIIQSTASDATLVALLSARARAVNALKAKKAKRSNSSSISAINAYMGGLVSRGLSALVKFTYRKHSHDSAAEVPLSNNCEAIKQGVEPLNPPCVFDDHDPSYFPRLVAYSSDQAHSSVEKGVMLTGVRMRKLRSSRVAGGEMTALNGNFTVEASTLQAAITEDREKGYTPFIFIATVGTTNTCGVDSIAELGAICSREGIWLHIDAAYAGSFLLCNEFRYLAGEGWEFVDSLNFNAHKAMMVNFDCSPLWFKDAAEAIGYFNVDPTYLKHEHQAVASDYRHLQVALGRRFRALKIWFVFRSLGTKHIQGWLRQQVELANHFAQLITAQGSPFELFVPPHLGLVCFRLKDGSNELNEQLTNAINEDGRIHLVAAISHDSYFLRFAVCNTKTTRADVAFAARVIYEVGEKLLSKLDGPPARLEYNPTP